MTGQTITSRQRPPLFMLLLMSVAATLIVASAVQSNSPYAVASLPLWCVAAALFVTRPRALTFTLSETAIEVAEPPHSVPYENIQGLLAGGRLADPLRKGARRFGIQVIHPDGVLEIPANLDVPSDEVYRYLFRALPARSTQSVHADLIGHLGSKQAQFGAASVWSFGPRSRFGPSVVGRQWRAICLALFLSALGWIAYGLGTRFGETWFGPGAALGFFSALLWLIFWSTGRQHVARVKHGKASLVIAPDGVAVLQGDLRGELSWKELLDMKLNVKARSAHFASEAAAGGIVLKVAGAEVLLTDVYDRPLPMIYHHLYHFWRGDTRQAGFDPTRIRVPAPAADGITAVDLEFPNSAGMADENRNSVTRENPRDVDHGRNSSRNTL